MAVQPLSIKMNTAGATTAIPLIADGTTCKFRLKSLGQSEKGDNDQWSRLVFEFVTTDPAPTQEGKQVQLGFPVFVRLPLGSKEDPANVPEWVSRVSATIEDALLGTGDADNEKGKPQRPELNAELIPSLIGKELIAKVKIRKADNFIGNDLGDYMFPGDLLA